MENIDINVSDNVDGYVSLDTILKTVNIQTNVPKMSNLNDVIEENNNYEISMYQPQLNKNKCTMKIVGSTQKLPMIDIKTYKIHNIKWKLIAYLYNQDQILNFKDTIKIMSLIHNSRNEDKTDKDIMVTFQFNITTSKDDKYTGDYSIVYSYNMNNVYESHEISRIKKYKNTTKVIEILVNELYNNKIIEIINKYNY